MIKYINDGEVDTLKKGFFNTLRLKKLQSLPVNEFMEGKVPYKIAEIIFLILVTLPQEVQPGYSMAMLKYLLSNNMIDDSEYEKLKDYFSYDEFDPDLDDKYDYVWERRECYEKILKKFCKNNGVEIIDANYSDIYYDDIDDVDLFKDIQNELYDYAGIDKEEGYYGIDDNIERESKDYFMVFMEDATLFVIENLELKYSELMILDQLLACYSEVVKSEAWISKGNTYISISDNYYLENTSCLLLITLMIYISRNKN